MLLIFEIDRQIFAIPLERVREVVPVAKLIRPPDCPAILEGFLNLRGSAVPVLRLAHLFGFTFTPGIYALLIVLRGMPKPLALLVEKAHDIVPADSGRILALPPEESFRGCVESSVAVGEFTALLLNPDRLLIEQEQHVVAAFRHRIQQRISEAEALLA